MTLITSMMHCKSSLTGNQRYASGKPIHPIKRAKRRNELIPHSRGLLLPSWDARFTVTSFTRADLRSRLGDLFVVRVAGNILDGGSVLGSLDMQWRT